MDDRVGFTTPNLGEAATDRALIACAREVIVLADSSKWGVVGLADIAPLSSADTIISDDQLPAEAVRALQEHVQAVILVTDEEIAAQA
jgi:DeoR/GlpR family transcriptional regulator of sugar metabolism